MFRQLAIIIGCLAVGEFIVWLTGITIPSSILGMLLLTFLLKVKVIKLEWVETISNFLVKNMGFFFVPPNALFRHYQGRNRTDCFCNSTQYDTCTCHYGLDPHSNEEGNKDY